MTQRTAIQFPALTGTFYVVAGVNASMPKGAVSLEGLKGPELVSLHNLIASNLGKSSTLRFATAEKGRERTWKLLNEYQDTVDADSQSVEGEAPAAATPIAPAAGADDFSMSAAELAGQKGRVKLTEADEKQIKDEAADRKPTAKRGSQAGTIRKPRTPKADDGKLKLPTEGGKQRAKRQKDGSYTFRIPAGKPRTETVSDERLAIIGHLTEGGATWASIKEMLGKPNDFNTVTTITMFCITLGYGLITDAETGEITLIEPLQ